MRAVRSHWPSAQWWRVGAWVVQVAREVAGSAIERTRRYWQVARRCWPVWGSRGKHGWVRGRLADWSCALSVLTGPLHVKVVRGCVGGPGRAQSCWKWIRARASLLASSAHVFARTAFTGPTHTGGAWVRGWSRLRAMLLEEDPNARVLASK